MVLHLPDSWSNWNLEMLGFKGRGKPEYPEKNLSQQGREPTTISTHIWCRSRDLNLGHIGGRRVLSQLHHPLLPKTKAKGKAPVNKSIIYSKQLKTCNHCKEIHLELSLRSVENNYSCICTLSEESHKKHDNLMGQQLSSDTVM